MLPNGWEVIGPAECPIMYRRTLVSTRWFKLLVHRFVANAGDEAPHDHPRSFLTVVVRGGYDDIQPCPRCREGFDFECLHPDHAGIVDEVRAPTLRYRRAEHAHVTKAGPKGATTVVVMGPLRREWGFFRDGRWYPWRTFERLFGLNWRCP